MKNLNCNAIVVVFIIVTAVLAFMISFGTLIQTAAAQQFSMSHRILLDNSEGNTMGWNPNGNRISFTIFDDQFNPETSTGQLHYTIINLPASDEGAQATLSQQVANQIAQRENAANQTQLR